MATPPEGLLEAVRRSFLDVVADIHGSIVYLDAGAAEVVALSLGPSFLVGLGAANVCDLERCDAADALPPGASLPGQQQPGGLRLVVFTTQLLTHVHPHLLHLLMVRHNQGESAVLCCAVLCCAHP